MTFKPNMAAIERWVADGQMKSDLDEATREGLKKQIPETLGAFARVFASPDGKTVLAYLAEVAVLRAPVDHTLEGERYLRYAQLRQGQQQIFATLIELKTLGDELSERKTDGHERTDIDGSHNGNGGNGNHITAKHLTDGGGWSDFDRDGDIKV